MAPGAHSRETLGAGRGLTIGCRGCGAVDALPRQAWQRLPSRRFPIIRQELPSCPTAAGRASRQIRRGPIGPCVGCADDPSGRVSVRNLHRVWRAPAFLGARAQGTAFHEGPLLPSVPCSTPGQAHDARDPRGPSGCAPTEPGSRRTGGERTPAWRSRRGPAGTGRWSAPSARSGPAPAPRSGPEIGRGPEIAAKHEAGWLTESGRREAT
jgi:hypothetical protein